MGSYRLDHLPLLELARLRERPSSQETATELDNLSFHIKVSSRNWPAYPSRPRRRPHPSPPSLIGAAYKFVDTAVAPHPTHHYSPAALDFHHYTTISGLLSRRLDTGNYLFFLPVVNR